MNRPSTLRAPGMSVLALALLLPAGGCALAERAENLLVRQQSAQVALFSAAEEVEMASPALAEQLYLLEDDLYAACDRLREAGQRRLEGRELGSGLKWAVMTSLHQCESKTRVVERMVQQAEAGDLRRLPGLETAPDGFDGN